jgi:hypothetical protein
MNEVAQQLPVPDDPNIGPDDITYRRVRDDGKVNVVTDKNGNRVASSAAFEDDVDGISVFLKSTLTEAHLEPLSVIDGFDGYVLATVTVEAIRRLAMGIVRDPNPADVKPMPCNVAHCLLKLAPMSITQNHRLRQKLARESTLIG